MNKRLLKILEEIRARRLKRKLINDNAYNSKNSIDLSTESDIVKSQDTNNDGGPGSGNFGPQYQSK